MIFGIEDENQSFEEQQKRQVKILMNKISFTDDPDGNQPKKYKYQPDSISPFLNFYKLLALRPCDKFHKYKLVLNIPDTIIFNDKDAPLMWMYTNQKGEVCRIDNSPYYTITSKMTEGALEKELVAVLKKPEYGYGGVSGNDVKVISAAQIKPVLSSILSTRSEVGVIQRFVKCQSVKPSIIRTAWRKNNRHEAWILGSNYEYTSTAKVNQICKFIVNTKMPKAFNAVKCGSQKYMKQTLGYIKNIAKFIETHLKITFLELVCDFIKDEGDNWWYINTRAFILQEDIKIDCKLITMHDDTPEENISKQKLETYTKCKKCKYCYKTIAQHLMTHKLTFLMILQCDHHLLRMGKSFSWLERSFHHHVDSVNLYVEHKVCDSCYKFYKQVQKLVKLQTRLAKLTGIKLNEDNKNVVSITSVPYFKGQSAQFGSKLQKVTYDIDMPQGWELPKNQQIKIQLQNEKSNIQKYRMMVYIHGIRDIPFQYQNSINHYYLEFEYLGTRAKYNLNFTNFQIIDDNLFKINLDKIKIIYFFASKRDQLKEYLKAHNTMTINLYENQEKFGTLDLELDDFKSDKVIKRDYFKMFSGKKVLPYLSWGLFVSIGFHMEGQISSSILKLAKKETLFLPDSEYHSPDPLPEEWISMIGEKPDKKKESEYTIDSNSKINQIHAPTNKILQKQIQSYGRRRVASAVTRKKPYY